MIFQTTLITQHNSHHLSRHFYHYLALYYTST